MLMSRKVQCILYIIQALVFSFLMIYVRPINWDDEVIRGLKRNGIRHVGQRSVLWVQKGYLDETEIANLSRQIDTAIHEIEKHLNMPFDERYFWDEKIHYYIKEGNFRSHLYYGTHGYRKPYILLPRVREGLSPHVHETVHLIAYKNRTYWMSEGLAVYLNEILEGNKHYMTYGWGLDGRAKQLISKDYLLKDYVQRVLGYIGSNKYPAVLEEEEMLYFLGGSFIKFVFESLGPERFMKVYNSSDIKDAFIKMTGKDIEAWKQAWLTNLVHLEVKK